jgi:hypothetical protein
VRIGVARRLSACDVLSRSQFLVTEAGRRVDQAAFRLRGGPASSAAILMRLLASTAAPTQSSKRSRPSARQRFMPYPSPSVWGLWIFPDVEAYDVSHMRHPRLGLGKIPLGKGLCFGHRDYTSQKGS